TDWPRLALTGPFSFRFALHRRVFSRSNGEAVHDRPDASPTRLSAFEAGPEPYSRLANVHACVPLGWLFLFSAVRCSLESPSPAFRPKPGGFRSTRGTSGNL